MRKVKLFANEGDEGRDQATRRRAVRMCGAGVIVALLFGAVVPLTATAALPPSLRINDVTVTEANGPGVIARFTVRLSRTSSRAVTVNYATVDGSAVSPSDYAASSGMLRFRAGQRMKRISIPIAGDSLDERTLETFRVLLSNPVRARIADSSGLGSIVDNDDRPTISVNNAAIGEGGAGTTNMVFTVALSAPSAQNVTVNYASAAGTASPGTDFSGASGTLTYAPGETTKQVAVAVHGDIVDENNETLLLNLSGPTNALIADGQGLGTIIDDDCTGNDLGFGSARNLGEVSGDTKADVISISDSISCGGAAHWFKVRIREDDFLPFPFFRNIQARIILTPNSSPPPGSSGNLDLCVFREDHSLVGCSALGGTQQDSIGVRKNESFFNDSRNVFIRVKGFGINTNSYTLAVHGNVFVPAENL
jgi:hypothetical protein